MPKNWHALFLRGTRLLGKRYTYALLIVDGIDIATRLLFGRVALSTNPVLEV
jgi:hypothetical protein